MKSFSTATQLSSSRLGEVAQDILSSDPNGSVLASISNAVYLVSNSDEVLWLVTDNIPMHPRAIQISGALPSVGTDTPFSVRGQHLNLRFGIDIDLRPALVWTIPRPHPDKIIPFEELHDRIRRVFCVCTGYPSPKGFGWILSEISRIESANFTPITSPEIGLAPNYARPILIEIVQACMANDLPRVLRMAEHLVGLGEGLTPSGDDFIGGLLYADFRLQEIYPQYQCFTPFDLDLFLENSRDRTNKISYTILNDLATGIAFDTLHRFMDNLLTDKPLSDVYSLGLEMVGTGHSTGWDLLAGLCTGMLLNLGSKSARSNDIYDYKSNRTWHRKVSYGY